MTLGVRACPVRPDKVLAWRFAAEPHRRNSVLGGLEPWTFEKTYEWVVDESPRETLNLGSS